MRGLHLIGIGMGSLLGVATLFADAPTVSRTEAAALERAADVALTNRAAAIELLEPLRRGGRGSAPLDYSVGNLWAGLEAYDEAVEAYALALEKAPEFEAARLAWGRVLALQGKWNEAEAKLRTLVRRDTAEEDVLLLYGHVLLALERYVSAETIYRRAMLIGDESMEAQFGLARVFMAQQRLPEAVAIVEQLIQDQPDDVRFWGSLADAQVMAGRTDAARITLETAHRLNLADVPMLVLLGELHLQHGQAGLAVSAFEAAMVEGHERSDLALRLAEGLLHAGADYRVEAVLDAVDPVERGAAYWRLRARWAMQQDDAGIAHEAYSEWLKVDPLNLEALLGMGDWHDAEGAGTDAVLWYERAARAAPQAHEPWLRKAQIALDRQQWATAANHLERAHVLSGDAAIERALQQVRRLAALEP